MREERSIYIKLKEGFLQLLCDYILHINSWSLERVDSSSFMMQEALERSYNQSSNDFPILMVLKIICRDYP